MEFRIADTFTDALARLPTQDQKAAKTSAFDLQMDPSAPGLQFHRIDKSKDRNFWSIRVNCDIRIIVHKTDASLLLAYVDHHDEAYAWAERRRIEAHPKTGAVQIVEVRELIEEIAPLFRFDDPAPPVPRNPPQRRRCSPSCRGTIFYRSACRKTGSPMFLRRRKINSSTSRRICLRRPPRRCCNMRPLAYCQCRSRPPKTLTAIPTLCANSGRWRTSASCGRRLMRRGRNGRSSSIPRNDKSSNALSPARRASRDRREPAKPSWRCTARSGLRKAPRRARAAHDFFRAVREGAGPQGAVPERRERGRGAAPSRHLASRNCERIVSARLRPQAPYCLSGAGAQRARQSRRVGRRPQGEHAVHPFRMDACDRGVAGRGR